MREVRFPHGTGPAGATIDTGYQNVAITHAKCQSRDYRAMRRTAPAGLSVLGPESGPEPLQCHIGRYYHPPDRPEYSNGSLTQFPAGFQSNF